MKTFATSGTGNQQTLTGIETDVVPVYENLEAVENDLSNLEEGQLGLTKDTGDELSHPVNAVESGNLHAVTSNAVASALTLSDIDPLDGTGISGLTLSTANQVAPYNGFITIGYNSTGSFSRSLYVNDVLVGGVGYAGGLGVSATKGFTYPLRKGDTFRVNAECNLKSARWFVNQ